MKQRLIMNRAALLLCLLSRVNSSIKDNRYMYSSDTIPLLPFLNTGQLHENYEMNGIIPHMTRNYRDTDQLKFTDSLSSDLPFYARRTPQLINTVIFPNSVPTYSTYYEISRRGRVNTPEYDAAVLKSDINFENMKSKAELMSPGPSEDFYRYNSSSYNNDDEDIRSSGRNSYENFGLPFYHNFEKFQHIDDNYLEKIQDKRYAPPFEQIKPVHEHIMDDFVTPMPKPMFVNVQGDNPLKGSASFVASVMDDYMDNKNGNEDTLIFNSLEDKLDWPDDVNYDIRNELPDVLIKSVAPVTPETTHYFHLDHNNNNFNSIFDKVPPRRKYTYKVSKETNIPLKSRSNPGYYNRFNIDDKIKLDTKNNYKGARDILDSFANNYGSEDHKKDYVYIFGNNADNGKKKKGFHRIYHKDEFLEDNEFYDNTNNKKHAEEKGKTTANIGGSEALLRSHSTAATSNAAETKNAVTSKGLTKDGAETFAGSTSKDLKELAKGVARDNTDFYSDIVA